jgi:hypothetical protein
MGQPVIDGGGEMSGIIQDPARGRGHVEGGDGDSGHDSPLVVRSVDVDGADLVSRRVLRHQVENALFILGEMYGDGPRAVEDRGLVASIGIHEHDVSVALVEDAFSVGSPLRAAGIGAEVREPSLLLSIP